MILDVDYIDKLASERQVLWEQISHSCTMLHDRPFARMADRVLSIEKELALAYSAKRLQRAKESERGSSGRPHTVMRRLRTP